MTNATLNQSELSQAELAQQIARANLQQTDVKKAPEATALNFDQTKSFSRYLEASCDCC